MQPMIINAALTGMVPQRKDSPHVPISPQEIIADARRCFDAGATILHLHARDAQGVPTYCKNVYQEIFEGVRDACPGVLISGSCSGRNHKAFWQRSQMLDLVPDFGSLTLGSLNFPGQASINDPQMIEHLATAMKDRGIVPEMEIFDLGMADYSHYLVRKQVINGPLYANLLLGSRGTLAATPENLCTLIRALPTGTIWSATGIGRFQFSINCLAVAMGGHVRVGLEDALYYNWTDKKLATNAGLINRVVNVAQSMQREVATPAQTREILASSFEPQVLEYQLESRIVSGKRTFAAA